MKCLKKPGALGDPCGVTTCGQGLVCNIGSWKCKPAPTKKPTPAPTPAPGVCFPVEGQQREMGAISRCFEYGKTDGCGTGRAKDCYWETGYMGWSFTEISVPEMVEGYKNNENVYDVPLF